ncbi:hypothetical protein L873DRAFT_1817605 [Choiromyces venosus 120613-1]|uniref:Uncharacterized protein n=1 Tax=Choiromyces venosus 120613-1 TaxID=1336337 RepID=A0A3N4J2A9_9PEZI|nr:hypothetical protein L873DRAFT_1817605 [Choiromyces venosus 120613-1]
MVHPPIRELIALAFKFSLMIAEQNIRTKLTTAVMQNSQIGCDKPMILDFIVGKGGGFGGGSRRWGYWQE